MESFFEELHRLGYVADQNATIELWNAEGHADRLSELAEEVSRFKPNVVLASATPAALAAKKSMPTTPIVFALVADPLGLRFGGELCQSWRKPDRAHQYERRAERQARGTFAGNVSRCQADRRAYQSV